MAVLPHFQFWCGFHPTWSPSECGSLIRAGKSWERCPSVNFPIAIMAWLKGDQNKTAQPVSPLCLLLCTALLRTSVHQQTPKSAPNSCRIPRSTRWQHFVPRTCLSSVLFTVYRERRLLSQYPGFRLHRIYPTAGLCSHQHGVPRLGIAHCFIWHDCLYP